MPQLDAVRVEVAPDLHAFYVQNNICEAEYAPEVAARPLTRSSVVVAAFEGNELVALARALCDGLAADIVEFCVALRWQGLDLEHANGSLIEKDDFGLGLRVGQILLQELERLGADFISVCCLEEVEEDFYRSLGLSHNPHSLEYVRDRRPYV